MPTGSAGGLAAGLCRAQPGTGVSTFPSRFVLIRLAPVEIRRTLIESVYIKFY
jgi:hypothetical protein